MSSISLKTIGSLAMLGFPEHSEYNILRGSLKLHVWAIEFGVKQTLWKIGKQG